MDKKKGESQMTKQEQITFIGHNKTNLRTVADRMGVQWGFVERVIAATARESDPINTPRRDVFDICEEAAAIQADQQEIVVI